MQRLPSERGGQQGEAIHQLPPQCPRCCGLLTPLRYSDWAMDIREESTRAWECVLCGEVIDPVIIANRLHEKRRDAPIKLTPPCSSSPPMHPDEYGEDHAPKESHSQVRLDDCSHHEWTIMTVLRDSRSLRIEEILERVPDLSWSHVFLAIRGLSHKGAIALHRQGFTYTVETVDRSPVKGETNGKTPSHY